VSSINSKLGLKPAGKRNMMKLPDDARTRSAVTSAVCPNCTRRGANLSKTEATPHLFCTHCAHIWPLVLPADTARET
jgi:hypothetical protein